MTTPAAAARPAVLVVIVNYRTGPHVAGCRGPLEGEVAACPGSRVAVVDNLSGDGSADVIAQAIQAEGWSEWASGMRAPANGGFSYGNNFAVRPALASGRAPAYF